MFGRRFKLFTLFGFKVHVDLSWLVIAVLVTWSLAGGIFPHYVEGLDTRTYWIMGVCGALGLFASIVFHEFAHSLVARQRGMPMKGITLFIFGGVAEMEGEPPDPKSEFLVAIAGPIASIALAALMAGGAFAAEAAELSAVFWGVLGYLAWINTVLVVFNMIPAFPLDGGRVLRSALWGWKNNLRWATRIVTGIGAGFGLALIGLGVFSFLFGNLIGGVWWFLIGLFLRNAAQLSYQQVIVRQMLEGEPVRRFMRQETVIVPATASVRELVEDYFYKLHFKMYPVVEDGELIGCVHLNQVKRIPKEEWDRHNAAELARPCSDENTIRPDEDVMKALSRMSRKQVSRLMVVEDGRLVGVLALKDLLGFLNTKIELEGDDPSPAADWGNRRPAGAAVKQ